MAQDDAVSAAVIKPTYYQQAWSWACVGPVGLFLYAGGLGFMTSHEYLADFLFIMGTVLLLIKLWTWEEAKHATSRKTAAVLTSVTLFFLIMAGSLCWATYHFNHLHISDVSTVTPTLAPKVKKDDQLNSIVKVPVQPNGASAQTKRQKQRDVIQRAAPSVRTGDPVPREQTLLSNNSPPTQQCAQGSQCNTATNGGTINNPTVINPAAPETTWQLSYVACDAWLETLKELEPTKISVGWFISDPGGARVGQILVACLHRSRWTATGAVLPSNPDGIVIGASSLGPKVEALARGLASFGLRVSPDVDIRPVYKDDMAIVIGSRSVELR